MENNNNGNDNNVNNNVNNNNNDNINLGAINLLITNFQSSTPLNDDDINVAEILMELFNQDNLNNQEEDNNEQNNEQNNEEENNEQKNNEEEQSDINSSITIRRSISQFNNFFNNYVRTIENPIEFQINNYTNNYSFINSFVNSLVNYDDGTSLFDNVLLQSLNQKSAYKNVISEEGKNELKKIKYKANDVYNTSCPISLIDFEEDQEVIILPCNHCFSQEAIEKWLEEEKAECPVCRFKLKNKQVKNNSNESNNINRQMQNQIEIQRQRQRQNDDIFQNRQNLFRSLSNIYSYNSIPINHPYGPFREEQLALIPHSYIPIANNDIINDDITNNNITNNNITNNNITNNFTTEEMRDIEMVILLSLNSIYDVSSNNLDELD